ncbi:MAG: glycosyltransferase [Bacteroidetes bacterium]|nr:glycosyltransferase [Bacteroidota bacterium]
MINSVNIISFDIPYPANYGGVIDVFYKIKQLHQNGIKIHLHCFEYGRAHAKELEALCEKVYYYKRKTGIMNIFSLLPYNVKSRQSEELAQNLLTNNFPIIFEVLHTCYLMSDVRFEKRLKIYRHSNIEHDYYYHLAQSEKKAFKKVYLNEEARKLKNFEKVVEHANLILAVNEDDTSYFKKNYPKVPCEFLPSFHPNDTVSSLSGKGDYILYNGNLSVSENYAAVLWLLENVFNKINSPIIIAGLNPPAFLYDKIKKMKHVQLIANPSEAQMNKLIEEAHIHVLYTEQATGLKLKLVNVLFKGRFVVCNDKMLQGTGINSNSTLAIGNNPPEMIKAIESLMEMDYNATFMEERKKQVSRFSNQQNAEKLLSLINKPTA